MTTPQNQLYNLADKIYRLTEMFEGEEDEASIFEAVRNIESHMGDILEAQQRLENLMNLIIKFLSKHEA